LYNELTASQSDYLARYMKGVSRSFAIVAPEVESPLDGYLATAYLICRVVDNIEDTSQPFAWQQARFAEFAHLLQNPQDAPRIVTGWEDLEWPGLTQSERAMMALPDGLTLWEIYSGLPRHYRTPIQKWADKMAYGMERSGNPFTSDFFYSQDGVRLPHTKADYDRYCFYVAGTVGRMITELAILFYDVNSAGAQELIEGSDACGRALQKTNIVKDFAIDLQRGYCYLPGEWLARVDYTPLALRDVPAEWKKRVLLDVVQELEDSALYVTALPRRATGFRRAALLMMLPAYETMLLAADRLPDLFTPRHAVKISRTKMGQCVLRARSMASDDSAIGAYAREMSAAIYERLGLEYAAAD
jgi:farnesyl-diphosphate farnesyltransferase